MILEIATSANVHDADLAAIIANGLANAQDDPTLVTTVLRSVVEFDEEPHLFRATTEFLYRNINRLGRLPAQLGTGRGSFFSYALENSSSLRNDSKLADATIDVMSKLDPSIGGQDRDILSVYLQTGNAFRGGTKVVLSNPKNRGRIKTIQDDDLPLTAVDIDKNETNLGSGVTVRVQKLSVDGSDQSDVRLDVEVTVDVSNELFTLKFSGNERFLVQSLVPEHVVEAGKQSVRFGIEILSQQIALMMVRQ